MSFESVPILDLALARDPETKPAFLSSLRDALLTVGFLYIKNIGIEDSLIQDVVAQGKAFFDLPQEEKLKIQMRNVPSFLGTSSIWIRLLFLFFTGTLWLLARFSVSTADRYRCSGINHTILNFHLDHLNIARVSHQATTLAIFDWLSSAARSKHFHAELCVTYEYR